MCLHYSHIKTLSNIRKLLLQIVAALRPNFDLGKFAIYDLKFKEVLN